MEHLKIRPITEAPVRRGEEDLRAGFGGAYHAGQVDACRLEWLRLFRDPQRPCSQPADLRGAAETAYGKPMI